MEKRLYRSQTDRIIFGICGGLGDYFKIDPVIIRVLAIVITIASGVVPGVVAYIVMGLVVPLKGSTAPTPRDSMRENVEDMRDTTVNLGQNLRGTFENKETIGTPKVTPL